MNGLIIEETFTRISDADRSAFDQINQMFPKFNKNLVEKCSKMEVWSTPFSYNGEDFCEYRLLNQAGEILSSKKVMGY